MDTDGRVLTPRTRRHCAIIEPEHKLFGGIMTLDQLGIVAGVFFGLLATFISLWNMICRRRQENPQLGVKLSIGINLNDGVETKQKIFFKITNVGRFPVVIVDAGFDLKPQGTSSFPIDLQFPKEVKPGLYEVVCFEGPQLLQHVKRAWVRDATDRKWYVNASRLRQVIANPRVEQIYASSRRTLENAFSS